MRHLLLVLNGMQEVLTVKYNGIIDCNEQAKIIHDRFIELRTSLSHTAPEHLIGEHSLYNFNQLQNIVNNYITYDDYNNIAWCREMIDIFQDPNYGNNLFI